MKALAIIVVVLVALAGPAVFAADGGTQSPFVMGAGARSLALGGANFAAGEEAAAPFWNPARLAWAQQYAVSGFHSRLFDSDVAYQYLGAVAPTTDFGSFGLGIFRLGVDGIEKRDASNVLLGNFDDSRLQFILAYGRELSGYDLGASLTLEHHSIANYSATSSPGLNLSAGRRFKLRWVHVPEVAAAIQLRNAIHPSMDLAGERVGFPTAADIGVTAFVKPSPGKDQTVAVSAALNKAQNVAAQLAAGIEYNFEDMLAARVGIRGARLSFGVGLTYAGFSFDYALVDRDLGSISMFTLTSQFGTPVSERRQEQAKKREAEFNQLMAKRLATRNREMVDALVAQADSEVAKGDLEAAGEHFDRALFLARSSELDTLAIQQRAAEVSRQIDRMNHRRRLAAYVDSASTRLEQKDYVAARYFAGLARQEDPHSADAAEIYREADQALQTSSSREEQVTARLARVDSLLAYGRLDAAYVTVRGVSQLAPNDKRVQQAVRRVDFERLRQRASTAYAQSDRETALSALDSALALFPGHQWCLRLKSEIMSQIHGQPAGTTDVESTPPVELNAEMQREVAQLYKTAQDYFTSGDLNHAIEYWEKVDRLAPNYENVRDYLVKAYKFVGVELYGRNRLEEAVTVWQKAARLRPDNEEIAGYIKRTESEIRKLKELSYEHEGQQPARP